MNNLVHCPFSWSPHFRQCNLSLAWEFAYAWTVSKLLIFPSLLWMVYVALLFRVASLSFFCRISLTVRPGSLICIVGPPGSGKSALLSAVAGDIIKSDGKLQINVCYTKICKASIWDMTIKRITITFRTTCNLQLRKYFNPNLWYKNT